VDKNIRYKFAIPKLKNANSSFLDFGFEFGGFQDACLESENFQFALMTISPS